MKIPVLVHNYTLITNEFRDPNLLDRVAVYNDENVFATVTGRKFAIIELHYFNNSIEQARELLNKVRDIEQVVVRTVELHADIVTLIKEFDLPNFVFYVCGSIGPLDQAQVIPDLFWLVDTMSFYHNTTLIQDNYDPMQPKPLAFDILYGVEKPHRRAAKDLINNSQHAEQFFQSEFLIWNSVHGKTITTNPDFWEDNLSIDHAKDRVEYNGNLMRPSQVIPLKLYNKAAYSIVPETNFDNMFSFYTEKTAKPLIAGRAFIFIAGRHYLRNLQRLGFKTFSDVIDESYDDILYNEQRWEAAIRAAEELIKRPQAEVLEVLRPVFEHNKAHVLNLYHNVGHAAMERHLEDKIIPFCEQG